MTLCVCCGNSVDEILSLGNQPLANNLLANKNDAYEEYALDLNFCYSCFHAQLSLEVDPNLLFKNYLYVSGTAKTLIEEFDRVAADLIKRTGKKTPKVLDIASNDGTFLTKFAARGCEVLGIDPAENLVTLASDSGIDTLVSFFGTPESKRLLQGRKFDIITAFNVLAHVPNPGAFLEEIETLLDDDDSICAVQTSQRNMFFNGEFDTIYHEHHSFFSIMSFVRLCEQVGLYLYDVQFPDIHGGSFLFIVGKDKNKDCSEIFVQKEQAMGRYDRDLYADYVNTIEINKIDSIKRLSEIKDSGYELVGFGAAAKAIVLLNYYKISLTHLIDENPLKWYKIIPKLNSEIIPLSDAYDFYKNKRVCFIVLAWNFSDEIVNKIKATFSDDAKMIVLLPKFKDVK